MHALLVDDNQIDRRQIRRLLQQTNPKVKITEASDAITAFEALQRTRFDCLVVDQRMPGVIGTELARALRSTRRGADLAMIMVSGDDMIAPETSLDAGFDAFLSKNALTAEALSSLIAQAAGSRARPAPEPDHPGL
jgi:CheY-like chemotaxis protein